MALTVGMLKRFESLVSTRDEHLLKVHLDDGTSFYGYLREVGQDFFVLDEIRSITIDRNAGDRHWRYPDYEVKIEKLGKTTLPLEPLKNWTEITKDALPTHGFSELGS